MPQIEKELPVPEASAQPRQTGPCVMVIFGATGDLTARKLFPALYNLAQSNMLSQDFAIIGVGRNDFSTEQFRQVMGENLQNFGTSTVKADLRDWLLQRLYYVTGDFKDPKLYTNLTKALAETDKKHNTQGTYFFYLATSPASFGNILYHLGASS